MSSPSRTAKKLKSRNKAERQQDERQAAGQYTFDLSTLDLPTVELSKRAAEIDLIGSDTIDQVRARADAWRDQVAVAMGAG